MTEMRAIAKRVDHVNIREELDRREGGPLGLVRVKELVVGAKDLGAEEARWDALLSPAPRTDGGAWDLADGPAIRLVADGEHRIRTLVLEVAALDRARVFLRDERMLGPTVDGQLTIDPASVFGLEIRLAESH